MLHEYITVMLICGIHLQMLSHADQHARPVISFLCFFTSPYTCQRAIAAPTVEETEWCFFLTCSTLCKSASKEWFLLLLPANACFMGFAADSMVEPSNFILPVSRRFLSERTTIQHTNNIKEPHSRFLGFFSTCFEIAS